MNLVARDRSGCLNGCFKGASGGVGSQFCIQWGSGLRSGGVQIWIGPFRFFLVVSPNSANSTSSRRCSLAAGSFWLLLFRGCSSMFWRDVGGGDRKRTAAKANILA